MERIENSKIKAEEKVKQMNSIEGKLRVEGETAQARYYESEPA